MGLWVVYGLKKGIKAVRWISRRCLEPLNRLFFLFSIFKDQSNDKEDGHYEVGFLQQSSH